MTILVTPDEMRAAEAFAIAGGRTETDLMRTAAEAIAAWLDRRLIRERQRVAIAFVGPGKNGGDTLVALALLVERGWRCGLIPFNRSEAGDLPADDSSLAAIEWLTAERLGEADVILDGVYGIGSRATLPDDIADAFETASRLRRDRGTPLVAIDVPSGVDAATGAVDARAFRADTTLCLGLPKIGLVREPAASCVGDLELLDLGISNPPTSNGPRMITEADARRLLPRRLASAHKHSTGAVLVVSGAPNYYGAPRLTGESALRAGAGLVALAAPAPLVPVIAAQVPELVFLPLDDDLDARVLAIASFIDSRRRSLRSLIVGPGLGGNSMVDRLLDRLLDTDTPAPDELTFVLDADALNWLARRKSFPRGIRAGTAALTPHAGELARLLQRDTQEILLNPEGAARDAAAAYQQTVVLKTGHAVIATATGEIWFGPRSVPELATAGTGDVLAGFIGGFMAQGLTPRDAALLSVFVGAMAGRSARDELGTLSVIATDIIAHASRAMASLGNSSWSA